MGKYFAKNAYSPIDQTLKAEEDYLNDYEDMTEARVSRIGHFITEVYHQKRRIRR